MRKKTSSTIVPDARSVVRRSATPPNLGQPLVTPLSHSVMYHYEDADQMQSVFEGAQPGYGYARDGHPNATVLSEKLSWMEGAEGGVVTASGMAAISAALLANLRAGDRIAAATQLYGRSLLMVRDDFPRMGFPTDFFDASDSATFADAIKPGTRIVLCEIVSNPMLRITQFKELAQAYKSAGALLLVDNTFTTPAGFRPLDHGADLVMQSVTKMLAGHSDVNIGYIGSNDLELIEKINGTIANMGFNSSPHSCWLAERGLQTFDLRHRAASQNAIEFANFLEGHALVERVHFPGLASHADHDLAQSLLKGAGTMVSFVLKGARANANAFLRAAKNIPYGPTLGDVATIMIMPAVSSHRKLPRADRIALGIEDNLVRVSLGIEDFKLIKRDFEIALAASALAN